MVTYLYVSHLSQRWLHNLNLKVFAVNSRNNLTPNLWCLCASNLSPIILSIDDQQVSFQVDLGGKTFGISVVYASTCYIKRRQIWHAISSLQTQHHVGTKCV